MAEQLSKGGLCRGSASARRVLAEIVFLLLCFSCGVTLRGRDDLELLINSFINNYNYKLNKNISSASPEFISKLKEYSFPGNIRELKNIIERAMILCKGDELIPEDLPEEIFENKTHHEFHSDSLKEIEKQHILKVYSENKHNKSITAEKLGIGSVTLYRKLKEYGVE